jgi:PncC family amidohydrolase
MQAAFLWKVATGIMSQVFQETMMTKTKEILLNQLLRERVLKLATAESCTGGLIADRITNIPGSSEYFLGGIVAYAYEAKVKLLGVSWDTLQKYGAVSREIVIEMARGARTALEADLAVSVSGIAGPGGGLPDKPVGTTWVGLSTAVGDWARKFVWQGDRLQNKALSAEAALQLVLDYLEGNL